MSDIQSLAAIAAMQRLARDPNHKIHKTLSRIGRDPSHKLHRALIHMTRDPSHGVSRQLHRIANPRGIV